MRSLLLSAVVLPLYCPWAYATDLEAALASFEIHPDFNIELAAAEPIIFDPVDLEFDEHGRAYVMEMPGYPFPDQHGSVVLIEDSTGDGRYDRRTVFAEDFPVADSLMAWHGGLLVASPPDLIFLKDTTGDGRADVREIIMSGFAVGNPQHNFCGLTYGLDNWIYGANGGNSGNVFWPDTPDERIPLRYDDFRIDIERKRFERIGRSTGGFEITFDDWGGYYATHNLHHISHLVFHGRYLEGLPIGSSGSLENISDHEENDTARIYPIGVQETRVNHPDQSGYFSGACGITHYGGGAFGAEFNGNIFVCDVVLNLVHRDIITPHGASRVASRAEQRKEFLASTDRSFRPVNLAVGPQGALYVVDMHRAVIEHPEWIPDEIQQHLDLEAGKSKGRIYRITPKAGLSTAQPQFDRDDLGAVVEHLGHPNQWWRTTAQRLLVEWRDRAAVPLVKSLYESATDPLARLHALWTLDGLGATEPNLLKDAFQNADPGLRENAIKIAELHLSEHPDLLGAIAPLAGDENPRVRMQALLTLGSVAQTLPEETVLTAATHALRGALDDPWIRIAAVGAVQHISANVIETALDTPALSGAEGATELAALLARVAGEREDAPRIAALVQALAKHVPQHRTFVITALDGLAEGVAGRPDEFQHPATQQALATALAPLAEVPAPAVSRATLALSNALNLGLTGAQRKRLAEAGAAAAGIARSTQDRLDNLALYAFTDFDERAPLLFDLLDKRHPAELQRAAIRQLADARHPSVAPRLIAMWPELGPETRMPASDILLYQRNNHDLLLTALEQGDIAIGQLNLHLERRRTLLRSRDPNIRQRAEALFSDAGVVTRREAIEAMRPALALQGDPGKGHVIFQNLCAQCHVVGGEGVDLGPNLTDIYRKSPETLLHEIIDPNAAVDAKYISFAIETLNGDFATGIVAHETDESITLREALGKETTFRRDDIQEMYSSGLSLMPEELEVGMTHQEMADLLAFLQQPR